jgi:hypothetical protein
MIVQHNITLETVINEDSNESTVKEILSMPEEIRNVFFTQAATSFIREFLVTANKNHTWAELRVAKEHE